MAETLKVILFDAGNTLIYFNFERYRKIIEGFGLGIDSEYLKRAEAECRLIINSHFLEQKKSADNDRLSFFFENLLLKSGAGSSLDEFLRRILHEHKMENFWSVTEKEIPETLKKLSSRYRLGVISNSDGRIKTLLAETGLVGFFSVVIDSHFAGVEKPSPKIFQMGLDFFGVSSKEAMYIGDLYDIDIKPALELGMEAVLLDPFDLWKVSVARIKRIPEILTLLEKI